MSNLSVFNSLKRISKAYSVILMQIPEDTFQTTPPVGGWSYSEVYAHIFDASLLSLLPLEECIKGIGKEKPTAFVVKVILFFGSLPPVKYKVPEILVNRVKKISKSEAEDLINKFLTQLETAYSGIEKASDKIKNKHPKLGYLNATQWLRFIEIHLKHHLKQLKRIEKSF